MIAPDIGGLPMHVLRPAQTEMDQPRADGAVGGLVDQYEAAQIAVSA